MKFSKLQGARLEPVLRRLVLAAGIFTAGLTMPIALHAEGLEIRQLSPHMNIYDVVENVKARGGACTGIAGDGRADIFGPAYGVDCWVDHNTNRPPDILVGLTMSRDVRSITFKCEVTNTCWHSEQEIFDALQEADVIPGDAEPRKRVQVVGDESSTLYHQNGETKLVIAEQNSSKSFAGPVFLKTDAISHPAIHLLNRFVLEEERKENAPSFD